MYYEIHGNRAKQAPTLVFSAGLGGSANFWQPQLAAFKNDYRIILYDHSGTGRSPATLPSPYSIEHMRDELVSLLTTLAVTSCHFIGHALGGLVGLSLAKHAEINIQSLILINAWSAPNPHTLRCFDIRKAILANCPKTTFLQMQALLLYPPDWIARHAEQLTQEELHLATHFPDKENLLARIRALSQFDMHAQLPTLDIPALVIANKDDMLVPWYCSALLAEALPCASLSLLDYGGHASTVTVANKCNALLKAHLDKFHHNDKAPDKELS
ncbi:MAG: pyrimidine utilization protein D [Alteromonadaceae bacterium]|nr:pyrimidine utilization protein D [Alteromonadaceae bacterium]|tara:strand:+ start:4556 stop:5368 length:813 start_codon:yes stop_codon:yes gene_type:complete